MADVSSYAIRAAYTGGPEVLRWEEVTVPDPGPGQVRLRHHAVGLNFIDVYHRKGIYPMPFPLILGQEGAGVVTDIGDGVTEVAVGDRVAYAGAPIGSYAVDRLYPAARLVGVPDAIPLVLAAALMLQGMTVEFLLNRTFAVGPGTWMLLHAAAGGVGSIASQWAEALGATVIGTVSTPAKAELARAQGCDHVVLSGDADWVAQVRALTDGRGVDVVYDSIGRDTFMGSLDCLVPRGMMVSFGQSSGLVAPFEPGVLAAKGSLFLTRPTMMHYVATRPELLASANSVFDKVAAGVVKITINQRYPLAEAARAHADLEARRTTGSTIFTV